MDCLILGDSIAKGLSQYEQTCEVKAKVGISSRAFLDRYVIPTGHDTVVISLGSNDGTNFRMETLVALREKIDAPHVYWIIPAINENAREAIKLIAEVYHDGWVDLGGFVLADGVHPTRDSYKKIKAILFHDGE